MKLHILLLGTLICTFISELYILSLLLNFYRVCAFGIYIFKCTDFCLSLVNYSDVCVIFLAICILRLVFRVKKEAVCFRNVWYCFEYYKE